MNRNKVLVAMSGGVDSAVCAYLLKKTDMQPTGITMMLWSGKTSAEDGYDALPDQNCTDAKSVADQLNIPHVSIALGSLFKETVVDEFINAYTNGLTPNPCVNCNKHVKFGALMDIADEMGIYHLATGHYARTEKLGDGSYVLKKAKDPLKDQSYFLWSIKKEYLPRILFPLGEYKKDDIRTIAREEKLKCAYREDSQDICFIPDGDYISFIREQTNKTFPCGNFISTSGEILGQHSGIINYTVGQRKGLGIALGKPVFVCQKDVINNTVTLCSDEELYKKELTAHSLNLLTDTPLSERRRYEVKIRYRHTPVWATVEQTDIDKIKVVFDSPQRAITSGQSVVLYDGDTVVGGGIID